MEIKLKCKKDFFYWDGDKVFTEGKIYIAEDKDGNGYGIMNDNGDLYYMEDEKECNYFSDYFEII